MESLKNKLTEEEARELIEDVRNNDLKTEYQIDEWRDCGYIKKSELEEAKQVWEEALHKEWNETASAIKEEAESIIDLAIHLFDLYEKEIKRLKDDK